MRKLRRNPLTVVQLEDRATPAIFTVTTTADNGDNAAPTGGSLRAAILAANAAFGADSITFDIPGPNTRTILPPAPLPAVTDAVTIDGTTQPNFAGTPLIRLNGAEAGAGANGLNLVNHTGSTVRGLAVGGFAGAGIRLDAGGQHRVQNNFIGVNPTVIAAEGNGVGVLLTNGTTQSVVGEGQTTRNVISGNLQQGVVFQGAVKQNTLAGNLIGVAFDGVTPVRNGADGVLVSDGATFTTIGGTVAGAGNIIAANGQAGVRIRDPQTAGTLVSGNRIGLDFGGNPSPNIGNGVLVENAAGTAPAGGLTPPGTNNTISTNTIQRNGGAGVAVLDTSRFVRVVNNSINLNGGLGLDIAPTAQNGLAAPNITNIKADSINALTVTGTVAGQPNTGYDVTIYTNAVQDPSGFGEGETKAATVTVTTDAAGNATFTGNVPAGLTGPFVSATATATTAGDTSAFSFSKARPDRGLDARLAFAAAGSGAPVVTLYDAAGAVATSVTVFDANFTGGVRVAAGDFNLDGVPDIVAGTGPGIVTRVRVIDPVTKAELFGVQPFETTFTRGVYVSAGDVTGDGVPDLIISPDEGGGPRVDVYSGVGFGKVASFFGIADPNFRGGARTAVGDVNNDGTDDLVVAAGFGGGPRVAVYDGKSVPGSNPRVLFNDFFAFEPTLRNGAFIAVGDLNDDGFAEVIAGGGPSGGPRISAFDGKSLLSNTQSFVANFFAGDSKLRGGIRVGARDLNADGTFELIAGDGPGGENRLRVYTGSDLAQGGTEPRLNVTTFSGTGGIFVG